MHGVCTEMTFTGHVFASTAKRARNLLALIRNENIFFFLARVHLLVFKYRIRRQSHMGRITRHLTGLLQILLNNTSSIYQGA